MSLKKNNSELHIEWEGVLPRFDEAKKYKDIGIVSVGNGGMGHSHAMMLAEQMESNVKLVELIPPVASVSANTSDSYLNTTNFLYTNMYEGLDFPSMYNEPNKLQMLRSLNLSKEQIRSLIDSPSARMEDESQEDYKVRRMLYKLYLKYRDVL